MIETSDNKRGATAYLRPPQAETFGPFDLDLVRNKRTIGAIAPSAAEGDCDDAFLRELASRINWEAFMRMALSLVIALALALSVTDGEAVEGSQDSSIRTFKGHEDAVQSVAFAPDGRTALSGSFDGALKLWDVATGKEIRTFKGHSKIVYSVAFAPDGRTALSGSGDRTLKLWDVAIGD